MLLFLAPPLLCLTARWEETQKRKVEGKGRRNGKGREEGKEDEKGRETRKRRV